MALVHTKYFYSVLSKINFVRHVSKCANAHIKKSVLISQSNNIYTNLALEHWIYKNVNFTDHHVLLITQNDMCIVIGSHQNPWLETNIKNFNTESNIQLARRHTNGSALYQDKGNINLTFFTNKEHFDSNYNLQLIRRSLFRKFSLKVNISDQQDLMIRNLKVSFFLFIIITN